MMPEDEHHHAPAAPVVEPWAAILEDARRYPSPHNSQPITVRVVDDRTLDVFYDLDLGLPAENFGIPFAHVCAGIFWASLEICSAGHGFEARVAEVATEMDFSSPQRLHPLGRVVLVLHDAADDGAAGPADADASVTARPAPATSGTVPGAEATRLLDAFRRRQTSRRPYDSRTVEPAAIERVRALAAEHGHVFRESHDPAVVARVIRVNQETLFDDLQHDAVHQEILTWLRTSKAQAARSGDGLSAETMLLPGPVLSFAMRHRGIWRWPVVGAVIRRVYLSTMRGVSQVAWFGGPFAGPADYLRAGRLFLRAWLALELAGVSLHPFGTVVTNPRSHADFVRTVGESEQDGRMVWMLVRLGYSKRPPHAHRRPLAAMVLDDDEVRARGIAGGGAGGPDHTGTNEGATP